MNRAVRVVGPSKDGIRTGILQVLGRSKRRRRDTPRSGRILRMRLDRAPTRCSLLEERRRSGRIGS